MLLLLQPVTLIGKNAQSFWRSYAQGGVF